MFSMQDMETARWQGKPVTFDSVRPDHPKLGRVGGSKTEMQPTDRARDMPPTRGDFMSFDLVVPADLDD
jgi:hypothetical protein